MTPRSSHEHRKFTSSLAPDAPPSDQFREKGVRWFFEICGQIAGPVSSETLQEMLERGELNQNDLIRRELSEEWLGVETLGLIKRSNPANATLTEPHAALASEIEADHESFDSTKEQNVESRSHAIPIATPQQTKSSTDKTPALPPGVVKRQTSPVIHPARYSSVAIPYKYADSRTASRTTLFRLLRPAALIGGSVLLLLIWFAHRSDPNVGRVSGKITSRQRPLASAVITFTDPTQGVGSSTILNNDGSYEFMNRQRGLPLGKYHVTITSKIDDSIVGTSAAPSVKASGDIPLKYQEPHTSGLKAEVVKGTNRFDFDLTD